MKLRHLQELTQSAEAVNGGGFFTEAKGYTDSSEFTDEFYGELFAQVTKMKKIMKNQKWMDYMKLTDFNMGTDAEEPARAAIKAVVELEKALQRIDNEFDKANGHGSDDDSDAVISDDETITDDQGDQDSEPGVTRRPKGNE